MLGIDESGNAIEIREQSPYDSSRIENSIPEASFVAVDVGFNPVTTFKAQAANQYPVEQAARMKEMANLIKRNREMRNADVMDQYREEICCEQGAEEISFSQNLLNKAVEQSTGYADFNRLEVQSYGNRGAYFPSSDWAEMVPAIGIRSSGQSPNIWTSKKDASNTNKEGQMSGYWGSNMSIGNNKNMGSHPQMGHPQMGDFWSDLLSQGESAIVQSVQTEAPKLISAGIAQATGTNQQPASSPPAAMFPAGAVAVPGQPGVYTMASTSTKSSVDTKMLMYGGAAVAGVLILLLVLRR